MSNVKSDLAKLRPTFSILGLDFILCRDEDKLDSLDLLPNVVFFRDVTMGEIPFSLIVRASADNDSLMSTRALFSNDVISVLVRDVGKWLTNLGYEDFSGSFEPRGALETGIGNARWDINEDMCAKMNPDHQRARLGKLNPVTTKMFGEMLINPALRVMMYRRVTREIGQSFHPVGTWSCDGESGHLFASTSVGSNPSNWFVKHLPEDMTQLEADFAAEFSKRWPKYPVCTFKLFNDKEREETYYKLTQK